MDGKVNLQIGYIGLIKLAVDIGAISWATAEIVYSKDNFELLGYDKPPKHGRNPFEKDRGEIIGVYCVAKMQSGDYLTTTMTLDEVDSIKKRSAAFKASGSGPWKTDYNEMAKKTVIKRAAKLWPQSGKAIRLQTAIEMLNEEEGIDFEEERKKVSDYKAIDYANKKKIIDEISLKFNELFNDKPINEKGLLVREHLKVDSWKFINQKDEKELQEILDNLNKIVTEVKKVEFTITAEESPL
jgi:recombinational DNA repair protein RecT